MPSVAGGRGAPDSCAMLAYVLTDCALGPGGHLDYCVDCVEMAVVRHPWFHGDNVAHQ